MIAERVTYGDGESLIDEKLAEGVFENFRKFWWISIG